MLRHICSLVPTVSRLANMLRSPCIVTVAVEIVLLLLLLLLLCFLTRGKPLVAQKSTEGNYEIYLVVNLLRPVVINYTILLLF